MKNNDNYNRVFVDFDEFKEICVQEGIKMTSFESILEFSELKILYNTAVALDFSAAS